MINELTAKRGVRVGSAVVTTRGMRVFRAIQRVALGIALAASCSLSLIPMLFFPSFPPRHLSGTLLKGSATSELAYRTCDYPVRNFFSAFTYDRWPYVYGIGTTALGGQYVCCPVLSRKHVRPSVVSVESGFGTL